MIKQRVNDNQVISSTYETSLNTVLTFTFWRWCSSNGGRLRFYVYACRWYLTTVMAWWVISSGTAADSCRIAIFRVSRVWGRWVYTRDLRYSFTGRTRKERSQGSRQHIYPIMPCNEISQSGNIFLSSCNDLQVMCGFKKVELQHTQLGDHCKC